MRQLLNLFLLLTASFVGCSRSEIELTFKITRADLEAYEDSQPTTSTDFDCFALNIVGEGIGNGKTNQSGTLAEILNGDFCTFPGASSTLVPASNSGATLKVLVVPGKNRLVQVLGIKSNVGCPGNLPLAKLLAQAQNSVAPTNTNFQGVYEIGRKIIPNLTQAQSLDIPSNFSASSESVALKNLRICKIQEPFIKFRNEALSSGSIPSGTDWDNDGSATGKAVLTSLKTVNANFNNSTTGLQTADPNARFSGALAQDINVSALTGFMVAKWTSINASVNFFCFSSTNCSGGADPSKKAFTVEVVASGTPKQLGFNIYNSSSSNTPAYVDLDTNFHVFSFRWSASDNILKMRSDLSTETSGAMLSTNALSITKPGSDSVQIGNEGSSNDFSVKEIRFYDQALTEDQRRTIILELADKYGVGL